MPTQRLYYDDSYRTQFRAQVVRRLTWEGKPALILDRTLFYPTSGGQMHDTGCINGISVVDVIEQEEEIFHILTEPIATDEVEGAIDWARRFDFMQQHTAFHILAQSFQRVLKAETLSSHLGETVATIDVETSQISDAQLAEVELLANQVVFDNRPVRIFFAEPEQYSGLPLRKPPPKSGTARIVEIEDFDLDPCGGTHVRRTGEVGLIKIRGQEKVRGNLRFQFYAGGRALADYARKMKSIQAISRILSVPEEKFETEIALLKSSLKKQSKKLKKLTETLINYQAKELITEAKARGQRYILQHFENRAPVELRFLALQVVRNSDLVAALFSKGEQVHVVIARPQEHQLDLRELVPELSRCLDGKGGGQPSLVEISGQRTDAISEMIDFLRDFFDQNIE
ncbi:hypothetical protein DRQ00_03920 [candidate division KSB1 bacterium]|nr:MAG: hypothetical protein DRQ00_03920 [candidate division KSB1 bacterium]